MSERGQVPEILVKANEMDMTEEQERAIFEQADRMLEDEEPKKKEAKAKPSKNLSGSQIKRRLKCKLLTEQKLILGYEVIGKRVIPKPKPEQTEEEVEMLISGLKIPRKQGAEATVKPTSSSQGSTPQRKRARAPDTPSTTEDKKMAPKRARPYQEEIEKPGEFDVIITYLDNHTEKIAMDAYFTVCNELASHVRSLLLGEPSPVFQSKGMRRTVDGRILVRTQDIHSHDIIKEATKRIKLVGPSGEKEFQAWSSSEAPAQPFQGPWKKFRVYIPGPRLEFEEIKNILEKQNPDICKSTEKWKSFSYYISAEEGNYNDSHLLVIGVDYETADILQKLDHKLHFNLWQINFKAWNNKEDEAKKED